jgi:DNA-3-methyladenine glycosylase I
MKQRCVWAQHASDLIQSYHDHVWGVPVFDDIQCFKYLIMESAHAGLSWEMILKREASYELAYEGFDPKHVATFDEAKIDEMMLSGIIKHRGKIVASIQAAKIVNDIIKEHGSFSHYLWSFVNHTPLITNRSPLVWSANSPLSDLVSLDLKRRGMKFVGSTIIQAYLQGIGIINDHDTECDLCVRREL